MNSVVFYKTYTNIPFCEREILRYAGCKSADSEISALMEECIKEAKEKLSYKVCWRELSVKITDSICDFGAFNLNSQGLAANLKAASKVILFAATLGVKFDRLIAKYTRLSPSKALMLQAIGAERIEALCDAFCADISKEYNVGTTPRFSPGYGDLPLDAQKDIFAVLDCPKRIGLTLNDSLVMSPSKSVTAFVGLSEKNGKQTKNKCSFCKKSDCAFRGAL